jgi:BA14K-like protein
MKKAIMLAGVAALLASPALPPVVSPALAQAPSGSYGSGNIIFPGNPDAAAAAGAYSGPAAAVGGGAFAHEPAPARGGDCAQRFKSYDPRTGTYRGHDGRRHICR